MSTLNFSTSLPGGAEHSSQDTSELLNLINQFIGGGSTSPSVDWGGAWNIGGSGNGASNTGTALASSLLGVLGTKPTTVDANQVTTGAVSSASEIYKQLLSQNPELANQIGLTSKTTTLGGASDALETYWKRIAGDSAASVLGAGSVGADSLLGYIPSLVTGKAVEYQGQQQNYLANLLGLSTSMGNTAVNAGTSIWQKYANNQNTTLNNYNSLLASAFNTGAQDYNTKSNAVLNALLQSSLDRQNKGYGTTQFYSMTGTPSGSYGQTYYDPANSLYDNTALVNQMSAKAWGNSGDGSVPQVDDGTMGWY